MPISRNALQNARPLEKLWLHRRLPLTFLLQVTQRIKWSRGKQAATETKPSVYREKLQIDGLATLRQSRRALKICEADGDRRTAM